MPKEPSYRTNRLVERPYAVVRSGSGTTEWSAVHAEGDGRAGSGEGQLELVLDLVYRRRWMIVLTFLLMVAVAGLYTYIQAPLYEAQSFILIDLEAEQARGATAETYTGLEDGSVFAQNDRSLADELFVLENSNYLVRRVAERLQESASRSDDGPYLPILYDEEGGSLSLPELTAVLTEYVDFQQVRTSNSLVQVRTVSEEPVEAAILANVYAQEYVGLTEEARTAKLTRSREFLQEQLTDRTQDLREAEEELEIYLRNNASSGPRVELGTLAGQIADLEARRDETRIDLQLLRDKLGTLESEIAQMDGQVVQNLASGLDQKIASMHTQIAELRAAKEQIETRYPSPEQRSDVTRQELVRLNGRIAELENGVRDLAQQFVESGAGSDASLLANLKREMIGVRGEEAQLAARLNLYESRIAAYEQRLRNMPQVTVELARLERQRASAERMVQLVSEQLLTTRLAGEVERGTSYVRVVREAGIGMPVDRGIFRNLVMGAILGLLLGAGLAVVSDKLDNRIFKPEQVREYGYGEIGVIPNMVSFIEEEHDGRAYVESDGRSVSTSLVAMHHPTSAVSEAYRFLRTNIQFRFFDASMKTLLVTSPNLGEGKSVTAANLAMFMARAGRKTVLVDTDLRRPRVHALFGIEDGPGLADLLLHDLNAEDVEEVVADLTVITAGDTSLLRPGQNGHSAAQAIGADELLGSGRMQDLLEDLRARFDVVVIDSPPVLAATDAAVLARECDSTIVVTRAGSTTKGDLAAAVEGLTKAGAVILGVLLNGFDISMAYGYKYRYQGYSKYGHYYGYSDSTS